jgi:hypothetical protein
MLTKKEFNEIKDLVESKKGKNKVTVANLLELLETQYVKENPLTDSFSVRSRGNCVNPTRAVQPPETELSKFEQKNKVKVRTAQDSMISDEVRNAPKVGE